MPRLITGLWILILSGLFATCSFAQQIVPQSPESGDLITPVNAQPLSIEAVSRRRGILTDGPSKNLIIFSCSGMSGASAAFFEAVSPRRRDPVIWQGFQLVFPTWTVTGRHGKYHFIKALNQQGKRVSLISDNDFAVAGFLHGFSKMQTADLSMFGVALSYSGVASATGRQELIAAASGNGAPSGVDITALEQFFREKKQRFIGCFPTPTDTRLETRNRKTPWIPELVSSLLSRISLAPEGFCLVINYSGVSQARNQGHFFRMLEHMRCQDSILQQLGTFVAGRKDTLLLVVDEPENGVWRMGESFRIDAFAEDLEKIPAATREALANPQEAQNIFRRTFPDLELPGELSADLESSLLPAAEKWISSRHGLSFAVDNEPGFNSGLTVLAQGNNAEVFFGISSFAEFFRRLSVAMGMPAIQE